MYLPFVYCLQSQYFVRKCPKNVCSTFVTPRNIHYSHYPPRGVPPYPKIYITSYDYELITAIQVIPLSEWQNLELEVFEVRNFGRTNHFFSPLVGDSKFLWALAKAKIISDRMIKKSDRQYPLLPMTH